MRNLTKQLAALGLVLSGCMVTVNGKQYDMLKGFKDDSAQQPQQSTPQQQPSAGATAKQEPAAAAAAGATFTLDAATSPNPLIIDVGAVPTPKSSIDRYASCSNQSDTRLSAAPVARVVVKAPTRLRMMSRQAGLLAMPGNMFRCYEHKTIGPTSPLFVVEEVFQPGTYDVYAMGNGGNVATHVELTIVDRVPADAAARLDAVAPLELKVDGTPNPLYRELELGAGYAAEHLKLDCARNREVVPLTRVDVLQSSTWKLSAPHERGLYLQGPDGKCFEGGGDLPKGRYGVFADARRDLKQAKVSVAVVDSERAFSFGPAPHVELTNLAQPLPVKATIAAAEFRPRALCGVGAREPSFYLDVKKPGAKAYLQTLVASGAVQWTMAGPLGSAKGLTCSTSWDDLAVGSYAVWVSGERVGQPAWAQVVGRFDDQVAAAKAQGDALAKLAPVPAKLELADRQVWWHYPWHPRDAKASVEALFLDAPAQLFVFVPGDVGELKAGEALLLEEYGPEKSMVRRATGERVQVRTERLVADKPATVTVPAQWPELKKPEVLKDAYEIASPTDALKLAKWEVMEAKRYGCVGNWMAKNDPTWGKNYELVNLRTGQTVTDQKFRQADKVCNSAAVEAAAKALTKEVYANRLALREKVKKTLVSKFK